ncbi:IGR protein motif-domain-containing protein [Hypoxylon trugodes]|uniref:IGR protein motif-domain-containing protein n=1 Tax=Hypoxylon trugodes TaxID=326681 RepID=UPI00219167AA|nr:IGR protein motif-domain-containing protein [Hypoxylon trugodes]KAI1391185.1 IGR protein motif-domain-containing protein [Hypoxylon trugodes]
MVRIKPFIRPQQLRAALTSLPQRTSIQPFIQPTLTTTSPQTRLSSSSSTQATPTIPSPTPFVPDVQTFLTVIGRGLSQHASKIPTWDALFSLTTEQLQELGIEPPRSRRYLLRWRQRFQAGQYGIGGDLQHVSDGKAELRVLESTKDPVNPHKYVVNVPLGKSVKECALEEMSRVTGFKVQGAKTIVGPYARPIKGGEAVQIAITEGMWEDKRGRKIDGGERRRNEVRYKKRIQERREMRERGEL